MYMPRLVPRRETAELAVDRHVRSGNVVGLGTGLIVRAICSMQIYQLTGAVKTTHMLLVVS